MQRLCEAYDRRVLFIEQTLDEYCYESLRDKPELLNKRDDDQVLSRYINGPTNESSNTGSDVQEETHDADSAKLRHICEHPRDGDNRPIVVVSQLLVWRFGS